MAAFTKKMFLEFIPPFLLRIYTGLFQGWHGDYKSWPDAKGKCLGYDSQVILEKVRSSLMQVKNGNAVYERDSVLFEKIQYSFPVLTALMWIASQNNNRLNVIDFGGSLGSTYFQNKLFLDTLSDCNWCIVEQPHFVEVGKKDFASGDLHFFNSIDDCTEKFQVDGVIFASVLPYLEFPYSMLEKVFEKNFKYIIIDRTYFINNRNDRITIQKVPEKIYKANYPCWFLNESKFINFMAVKFDLIFEFESPAYINIRSLCKGYLYRRKSE